VNGNIIDEPMKMANLFNEFFTSMPTKIVDDLHPVPNDSCPAFAKDFFTPSDVEDDTVPRFKFAQQPVTTDEILEATKALLSKTSLDHNGVSMSFIKKIY
jgi:hypothetical protein